MGESKLKRIRAEETLQCCAGVQTPAGKVQVRWEPVRHELLEPLTVQHVGFAATGVRQLIR